MYSLDEFEAPRYLFLTEQQAEKLPVDTTMVSMSGMCLIKRKEGWRELGTDASLPRAMLAYNPFVIVSTPTAAMFRDNAHLADLPPLSRRGHHSFERQLFELGMNIDVGKRMPEYSWDIVTRTHCKPTVYIGVKDFRVVSHPDDDWDYFGDGWETQTYYKIEPGM